MFWKIATYVVFKLLTLELQGTFNNGINYFPPIALILLPENVTDFIYISFCIFESFLQVNLCQKLLFLYQLTHNKCFWKRFTCTLFNLSTMYAVVDAPFTQLQKKKKNQDWVFQSDYNARNHVVLWPQEQKFFVFQTLCPPVTLRYDVLQECCFINGKLLNR